MKNKNAIKKAISLAVLTALVQTDQAKGLGWGLSDFVPGFVTKSFNKVVKSAIDTGKYLGWNAYRNGVEKFLLRSQRIQDKDDPSLFAPAHGKNCCWLSTVTMIYNACLTDRDLEIIRDKLKEYLNDEWTVMKKDAKGTLVRDRNLLIDNEKVSKANVGGDSLKALLFLTEDCIEMRKGKKSKLQRVRPETQAVFGYNGFNASAPRFAMFTLTDALDYCGYELKWETVTSDIVEELNNRKHCTRVAIPICGKEPMTGHNHVYCVIATNTNGNWSFKEMNDMSGSGFLTTRFYGYSENRSIDQVRALIEESKKLNHGDVEMVTIEKMENSRPEDANLQEDSNRQNNVEKDQMDEAQYQAMLSEFVM